MPSVKLSSTLEKAYRTVSAMGLAKKRKKPSIHGSKNIMPHMARLCRKGKR
jgi:hypothetical protein